MTMILAKLVGCWLVFQVLATAVMLVGGLEWLARGK